MWLVNFGLAGGVAPLVGWNWHLDNEFQMQYLAHRIQQPISKSEFSRIFYFTMLVIRAML
jgi:hypothetical protein